MGFASVDAISSTGIPPVQTDRVLAKKLKLIAINVFFFILPQEAMPRQSLIAGGTGLRLRKRHGQALQAVGTQLFCALPAFTFAHAAKVNNAEYAFDHRLAV